MNPVIGACLVVTFLWFYGLASIARASEIALEGSAGPRTSWIRWIGFPAGNYIVTATVRNTVRVVAREVRQLMVVGF